MTRMPVLPDAPPLMADANARFRRPRQRCIISAPLNASSGKFVMPFMFLTLAVVGVIAFSLVYVWLLLHRSRALALQDVLDDVGLDRALEARREEAGV